MLHQSSVSNIKIAAKPSLINKKSPVQSLESIENEDERFRMISEAAYYRGQSRGFDSGDNVQDWLLAEADIDGMSRD